jgi:hypothetical protein
MTRDEKLSAVATYLNGRIDVPLLPEVVEQQACEWLMAKLSPLLTDPMLEIMVALDGGLSDVEIGFFEPILANYLDHLVDIPFVSDATEAKWAAFLSGALLDLLRKGTAA